MAARHKRYFKTAAGKSSKKKAMAKYVAENPKKYKAVYAVSNALRDGKITKAVQCENCGSNDKLEGHHHDYDKPLDVVWVCNPCHREIHK